MRNPRPGTGRPKIRAYIGAKKSSIWLQKIQRIQAVTKAGRVTKNPAMKRTLSQFFAPSLDIANDHDTDAGTIAKARRAPS